MARFGLCLIMTGVAIYGMLGLIPVAEADGTIARGNPGPVADGSTHTYDGCIAPFLNIGNATVDSLVPYLGGVILVVVADLLLVYRKYAGDNNHGVIMVEN
jgi:hypothetical protein